METKTDRGILECMTRTNALPCIDIGWKWDIFSTVVWCNSVKDDCKQEGATVEGVCQQRRLPISNFYKCGKMLKRW